MSSAPPTFVTFMFASVDCSMLLPGTLTVTETLIVIEPPGCTPKPAGFFECGAQNCGLISELSFTWTLKLLESLPIFWHCCEALS